MTPSPVVHARGNYLRGAFRLPAQTDAELVREDPGDLGAPAHRIPVSLADVGTAVAEARRAFPAWAALPFEARRTCLERYQLALSHRSPDLVGLLAREVGKPLWECQQEMTRLLEKIPITMADALRAVDPMEFSVSPGVSAHCRYRARGVLVVLGPFNLPAHLAHGQLVPALVTGNAVIYKPSELTPAVGQVLTECLDEAGFPPGVVGLVQGGPAVGRALVSHAGVDGILFTGSYATGLAIKEATLHQPWKLVVLEMGGKNSVMILPDAELGRAVYETLVGACLTTGQRCTATSRVIVHRAVADQVIHGLVERAHRLRVGYAWDDGVFMGPLVTQAARQRFLALPAQAAAEGAAPLLSGDSPGPRQGYYVRPSLHLVRTPALLGPAPYQHQEHFAPDLAVYVVDDLDEALRIHEAPGYGLVVSVFTTDRAAYEHVLRTARSGVINWNRPTTAISSRLPFGGQGKSGNGFPAGIASPRYCTYPVASIEDARSGPSSDPLPGT